MPGHGAWNTAAMHLACSNRLSAHTLLHSLLLPYPCLPLHVSRCRPCTRPPSAPRSTPHPTPLLLTLTRCWPSCMVAGAAVEDAHGAEHRGPQPPQVASGAHAVETEQHALQASQQFSEICKHYRPFGLVVWVHSAIGRKGAGYYLVSQRRAGGTCLLILRGQGVSATIIQRYHDCPLLWLEACVTAAAGSAWLRPPPLLIILSQVGVSQAVSCLQVASTNQQAHMHGTSEVFSRWRLMDWMLGKQGHSSVLFLSTLYMSQLSMAVRCHCLVSA